MTGSTGKPYIVLVGPAGAGKTTLIKKVTDHKKSSSDGGIGLTQRANYALSTDNSLLLCDTPGVSVMNDKSAQNAWIALSLNLQPVSQILITVKADTRMENVIDRVKEFSSRLAALDNWEAIGLVVTNMDNREIGWTETEFYEQLKQSDIPITEPIFSKKDTKGPELLDLLHNRCRNPDRSIKQFDMSIQSELFPEFFKPKKLTSTNAIRREKNRMSCASKTFLESFDRLRDENEKTDLLFEFCAWGAVEIAGAQKRVENDMKELVEECEHEWMHLLDFLKDVLTAELFQVKQLADDYNKKYVDAGFRACPFCGLPWTKSEGCDGWTTCGGETKANRGPTKFLMFFLSIFNFWCRRTPPASGLESSPMTGEAINREGRTSMASFTFEWAEPIGDYGILANQLVISKKDSSDPSRVQEETPGRLRWATNAFRIFCDSLRFCASKARLHLPSYHPSVLPSWIRVAPWMWLASWILRPVRRLAFTLQPPVCLVFGLLRFPISYFAWLKAGSQHRERKLFGCSARITWKEMTPLNERRIPHELLFMSRLTSGFNDSSSEDEEAVTFYVIPTKHGLENLEDLKIKIKGIEMDGIYWRDISEMKYNSKEIKKQLKVKVNINGTNINDTKLQLDKTIEKICTAEGLYVNLIENLIVQQQGNMEIRKEETHNDDNI